MDLGNIKNRLKFATRDRTAKSADYRSHEELIEEARKFPARMQKPEASSFAGWVFDLSHPSYRGRNRNDALRMGKEGERRIERQRLWANHTLLPVSENNRIKGWGLFFVDPLDGSEKSKEAPELRVKGKPFKCLPDVVMLNEKSNEILIIERKITKSSAIPQAGWPNVKAQLWCYSWIDEFQFASTIYLATEIWRYYKGQYLLSSKMPRWRKNEEPFYSECLELFQLFGGELVGKSSNKKLHPRAKSGAG